MGSNSHIHVVHPEYNKKAANINEKEKGTHRP